VKKKIDVMFSPNSFLLPTAKSGCCWDPSFAMGLHSATETVSLGLWSPLPAERGVAACSHEFSHLF